MSGSWTMNVFEKLNVWQDLYLEVKSDFIK
jgi:hypothetical protein